MSNGGWVTIRGEALAATFAAGVRGELGAVRAVLSQSDEGADPEVAAWRFALEALLASHDGRWPLPWAEAMPQWVDAAPEAVFAAFEPFAHAALLGFDGRIVQQARSVLVGSASHAARRLELFGKLFAGTGEEVIAAQSLREAAADRGDGPGAVEAVALSALSVEATAPPPAAAVSHARRATLMAQSEGAWAQEYLAFLVLARARRRSGRPHLALQVLTALGSVAPLAYRPWIGWESLLCGDRARAAHAAAAHGGPPAWTCVRAALALLDACHAGDRPAADEAAAELRTASGAFQLVHREAEALIGLVDPLAPASPAVAAWRCGETDVVPEGVLGLAVPRGFPLESDRALAAVWARPSRPGLRLLLPGIPLVHAPLLPIDEPGGARTDMGLAALALAGPSGLPRAVFFQRIYGFPFVPIRHQGVLDVLVHRMRARLGATATLVRDGSSGALELSVTEPFLVPDARCTLPSVECVLWALARLGTASAQQAAAELHMPLRTVQAVLRGLVDEGTCQQERDGRRVAYRVEDTSFTSIITVE